jgi:hypothetical protein
MRCYHHYLSVSIPFVELFFSTEKNAKKEKETTVIEKEELRLKNNEIETQSENI